MNDLQRYNPQWNNRFQSLSAQFIPYIEEMVEEVLHLGDTSVKGLSANPILKITIVVEDFSKLETLSDKLRIAGYKKIEQDTEHESVEFGHTKSVPHSLQIIKKSSLKLKKEQLLKKHLEENPAAVNELEALNRKYLQGKIPRAKYLAAKTKLEQIYVKEQGMSEEELAQIC